MKKRLSQFPKHLIFIILLVLTLFPPLLHSLNNPIMFHQFQLEEATNFLSAYSSGTNILFGQPMKEQPSFNNQEAMFAYIFSWLPCYAFVHPTEGIYYFTTTIGTQNIAGNIRVADFDEGEISFAYYDVETNVTHFIELQEQDGVTITKRSKQLYDATYQGRTVHFILPNLDVKPLHRKTIPEEQYMAFVYDESGLSFDLYFNKGTSSFSLILRETTRFKNLGNHYFLHQPTGFIFYHDVLYNRKILVGVAQEHFDANNYYDGPSDQTPYNFPLLEYIQRLHPYLSLPNDVDAQGYYQAGYAWGRLVIRPYMHYKEPEDVLTALEACDITASKSEFWTCLTQN